MVVCETNPEWKKILYKQQDFPDNYVDDSFLEEMKRNVNTRTYSISTLVYEAAMVSQQLSSIAMFGSVFCYMDLSLVSPSTVLFVGLMFILAGYCLASFCAEGNLKSRARQHNIKSVMLVLGVVLGLSPLLKTLTKTISTDTIYAMTVCMLITNLLFHDYFSEAVISSRSLSLNASVFASVCLASRLPTSWHAFVTVLLAMQIFAVMPQIRATIKDHHKNAFVLLTVLMACAATIMVYVLSFGFAFALVMFQFSIIFIFPYWMVKLQRHKKFVAAQFYFFDFIVLVFRFLECSKTLFVICWIAPKVDQVLAWDAPSRRHKHFSTSVVKIVSDLVLILRKDEPHFIDLRRIF